MKKYLITLALLLSALSFFSCSRRESYLSSDPENAYGQSRILKGKISGVLTLDSSPYMVKGDIEVDSLSTLRLEPGVSLIFSDSSGLIVRGKLICEGEQSEPVMFTADNLSWKGIRFLNSKENSLLSFAIIEKISLSFSDSIDAGAVDIENSSVTIHNSIIRNNTSYNGGGVYLKNSECELKNNILRDNHAVIFGGAILSVSSRLVFINNTVYKNSTENFGGGLVIREAGVSQLENNIFFSNSGRSGDPGISFSGDSTALVIKYNFLGYGVLSPLFISAENLHLSAGSPCINNGDPDPVFNDPDKTRNDQGAYGGPLGNW